MKKSLEVIHVCLKLKWYPFYLNFKQNEEDDKKSLNDAGAHVSEYMNSIAASDDSWKTRFTRVVTWKAVPPTSDKENSTTLSSEVIF